MQHKIVSYAPKRRLDLMQWDGTHGSTESLVAQAKGMGLEVTDATVEYEVGTLTPRVLEIVAKGRLYRLFAGDYIGQYIQTTGPRDDWVTMRQQELDRDWGAIRGQA